MAADRSNTDAANNDAQTQADAAGTGKGRPTPSRKEREAARRNPLVPTDRKAAAKASREKAREERQRQTAGMNAGDERFMPVRDKGPQKRYARDYVDARWSVGEFLIPIVVVLLIVTVLPFPKGISGGIQGIALIVVWVFFALTVIDCLFIGWQLSKQLSARFGSMDRGIRWYASMRAVQLRRIRMPKPVVARGQFPE